MPPRIGTITVPTDPFWIQVLEAIVRTSQKNGDELVVLPLATSNQELNAIPPEELLDHVLAQGLDVLICATGWLPILRELLEEKLPIICLDEIDLKHPFLTVTANLYQGGRIAGDYIGRELGGKGHTLCITAAQEKIGMTGQSRMAGFCEGIGRFAGVHVKHIPAFWRYDEAHATLLEQFKNYPVPIDAIFGVSDSIILAARDAGRNLGIFNDNTILVGLNGDPVALAAIAEGSLTATVDTSGEDLGAAAATLAHQAALGMPLPPVLDYHFQLITRENVASVATRKMIAIADIPTHMVGYSRQQERERLSQLEVSMEIMRQIGSLRERDRVAQIITNSVREHYGYDWVRILRWSEKQQALVIFGGDESPSAQCVPIEQDALLAHAYRMNESVFIPDTQTSRHWQIGKEFAAIRSRAVLPIRLGTQVIGVLDLQASRPVRQPSLVIVGLELLATQLGIVIQNEDLYSDALQARAAAENANQLKTRLIANVGHEMRSPLTTILGLSQELEQTGAPDALRPAETLAQNIKQIYKNGEHLMYMINDLLDLSRAEIGALALYFEPLEATAFLRELFQEISRSELGSPQVQWNLEIPERLPVIRADCVRLRQILTNLMVNSRKFTRTGCITLGAQVEPPYLHFWVRDTGQGIPIELQEKIFEPFGITTRKRRPEGIGLGLSITRHLVALHGGTITLESQPAIGSTFNIYLPLPGVAQIPTRTAGGDDRKIMLVVSHDMCVPSELEQICVRQNLVPVTIANHTDLETALSSGRPCAIAWDLAAAHSNEWMLIQRVSSMPQCAALPFLLFGKSDADGKRENGLTQVVYKPFSGDTLQGWLHQISAEVEHTRSILVVDDDPECRAYYLKLLHESHPENRIILAHDGKQALEMLETETPALILLDLMMPQVDGFTVLERVRNNPRTRSVPVLVISGKLLNYQDVQRLNHLKTLVATKGILSDVETTAFIRQLTAEQSLLALPTSLVVKQAVSFIHQNYVGSLTRRQIATAVGVNQNYLSQIFRQEMNISPLDYLTRLRIQKAQELLLRNRATITQIASEVGFNDSAYFSRVFHKMTGLSPQQFRQGHQ